MDAYNKNEWCFWYIVILFYLNINVSVLNMYERDLEWEKKAAKFDHILKIEVETEFDKMVADQKKSEKSQKSKK